MPKLIVQTNYPIPVVIDGVSINITVARMDVDTATAFNRDYDRVFTSEAIRQISNRTPEEMEKRKVPRPRTEAEIAAAEALAKCDAAFPDHNAISGEEPHTPLPAEVAAVIQACRQLVPPEPTTDAFVVSDLEVQRRRLSEMTPDARAAWHALNAAEDRAADEFMIAAITAHITVEEGELEEKNVKTGETRSLTTGADLIRAFGARMKSKVLFDLVNHIRIENGAPESTKKIWRSLYGLSAFSAAPATDPVGSAPVPTAPPAGEKDSAPVEAATALSATG